jgi:hypothetical protein
MTIPVTPMPVSIAFSTVTASTTVGSTLWSYGQYRPATGTGCWFITAPNGSVSNGYASSSSAIEAIASKVLRSAGLT